MPFPTIVRTPARPVKSPNRPNQAKFHNSEHHLPARLRHSRLRRHLNNSAEWLFWDALPMVPPFILRAPGSIHIPSKRLFKGLRRRESGGLRPMRIRRNTRASMNRTERLDTAP